MNDSTVKPLAIIIPAYKTRFLRTALASIAAQTDQNFQLYVFDDCSPEPVEEIVREFTARLPVRFHRFEENLGGISLARHWERCLRQTGEPWIWIFADDDVMESGCVAGFYAELDRTRSQYELYRFSTNLIDGSGARIAESLPHPPLESGVDFLLARLGGERNVTMQEAIFSRRAWEAAGGLPDFPLGWHSDVAFAASLGQRQPLCAIPGARVNWRYSDLNISSAGSFKVVNRKIIASTIFYRWAVEFFQAHAPSQTAAIIRLSESRLMKYVRTRCWTFIGLRACLALDRLAREIWQRPRGWGFLTGQWINLKLAAYKIRHRLGGRN